MKRLFITVGIPGAGKSTFSNKLKNVLSNTTIISYDDIRLKMTNNNPIVRSSFAEKIEKACLDMVKDSFNTYDNVIYDTAATKRRGRKEIIEYLSLDNDIEIVFIEVNQDLDICIDRVVNRNNDTNYIYKVSKDTIIRLHESFEHINIEEIRELNCIFNNNFNYINVKDGNIKFNNNITINIDNIDEENFNKNLIYVK